jgi:hypothetical protein
MMCIRDRGGNVISQSRNLAGIRRYVGGHTPPLIKVLDVSEIGDTEGKLGILFENGCSFEMNFASFSVLKRFVSRWRNVHGAPLTVNGQRAGVVSARNPV